MNRRSFLTFLAGLPGAAYVAPLAAKIAPTIVKVPPGPPPDLGDLWIFTARTSVIFSVPSNPVEVLEAGAIRALIWNGKAWVNYQAGMVRKFIVEIPK